MERKKAYYWCTCLQMITPIKVRRLIEEAGGPSEVLDKAMRSLFKWDLLQGSKEFIMKPAQWKKQ